MVEGPFDVEQDVLDEIALRFSFDIEQAKKLGAFHNVVLEVRGALRKAIVRISRESHRSVSDVEAEVEWVNHLCDRGAPFCRPIVSSGQNFVERVGNYTVMKMQKASGEVVPREALVDFAALLGKTLGKLHALSKNYEPQNARRHQWHEDHLVAGFSKRSTSAKESAQFANLCDELHALPKGRERYGLVHNDLHSGNFLVSGQHAISIFDTDDACYQWYMGDVAMVLFYALMIRDDREVAAASFFRPFWAGYCEENTLALEELDWLPLFFRRRAFVVSSVIASRGLRFLTPARRRFYARMQELKSIDACESIDFRALL